MQRFSRNEAPQTDELKRFKAKNPNVDMDERPAVESQLLPPDVASPFRHADPQFVVYPERPHVLHLRIEGCPMWGPRHGEGEDAGIGIEVAPAA